MPGFGPLVETIIAISLAGLPIAFVGLMFLHAARAPKWAWVLSGRTQIVWLASLIFGAGLIPLGVPLAVYYALRVRPVLDRIERGDLTEVER